MIAKFQYNKATYIFNIIAIIILVGSIAIYSLFEQTSSNIKNNNLSANIEYIDNITSNISSLIKDSISNNIYQTLKENQKIRDSIEKNLQVLITNRYRYIYVVDKEKHNSSEFRFLLDGSKNIDDKSEFGENYVPLDMETWNKVYKTKKPFYFEHHNTTSVWLTYLKPIIINDKVSAIIVIDFSLKDHDIVVSSLDKLDNSFATVIIFSIIIFLVIIVFSYIDKQRITELQKKSKEIVDFNNTLKDKIEEELKKSKLKDQQIIQQSRLAQMGEMISMIAHQWRQPLAAISSTSTALALKAKLQKLDNDTTIALSTKISEYSKHLSSTIDDFRDFFKVNKEKTNITYNDLIYSILDIVEISITNKNITLIKELNSNDTFYTYPSELKQVILNIIKNAEDILIDNNIKNAQITIETEGTELIIRDNAGGVPEDIIDKIFDPYFSTKTKKDGTGLGLYMSKTITEEHCGGKLTVSNDQDGAVFKIILGKNNA